MGTPQTDGIPPTFAKKPSIRQEDEGRRLLFECRILADPKPSVYWFHDNNAVKESSRCKVICCTIFLTVTALAQFGVCTIEKKEKYSQSNIRCGF
ncbi:hypothetical protein AVEN_133704-1 [Araneus ventricosus]|uniref:Ig-like domain-containing protein n=1 Tax=Araneus ventricosus TaxID=182803 RepID=A0A4Y2B9P1_ARAVE|nr:hypothetical protein AVEN_133704-1 [Araneus ventricosus]